MSSIAKLEQSPAISETNQVLAMISRVATDPNCDIEKMERLMQMRRDEIDREAKLAYSAAMIRVQSAMPSVYKAKENKQTRSFYADLEAVTRIVTPVYTAEGFSLSFNTGRSELEKHVLVTCTVLHNMGHSQVFDYDSPIDDAGIQGTVNKTPQHGRASAISYAQRYLTKLIFNLIMSGEDNDGNGGGLPNITESQIVTIDDYIESTASNKKAFLGLFNVDATHNIKAADYDRAMKFLKQKEEANKKAGA